MSKFGIDVSQHNGNINWEEVRNHIDFAILRLGWIGNKNNHTLDTQFERNYNECKRLGIPVGVYVYNYCLSVETAESGANWAVDKLQGKSLELPVYIDAEDPSEEKLGKRINTDMCIAFNSIIEQSGRWAGVYANRNWFDNFLYKDEIKSRYTTWIATYCAGTNKYEGEYDMWQNSSDGHINGINGRVDTNYMYRDLIAEIGNIEGKPIDNNKEGSDEEVRLYCNGSTREDIFSDTYCTNKIGSLDPYEQCDCFGEFNGRAMVRYHVNGTDNYKIGFAKWLGGIK